MLVLLAVKVQCVSCSGDTWFKIATPASHLEASAPPPQPHESGIWYVHKTFTTKNIIKIVQICVMCLGWYIN